MDRRVYENYVMQVAEQGSLTKAAAILGISQPALSSGLNSLEKDLGIKIFNRRSIPVSFTPEGLVYYDYVKRLRVLNDDFRERIEAMREDAGKSVVIGGPSAYVESLVTDAVMELRKISPECSVRIKTSPLADLIEMATAGKLNCFISTSDNLPENFEKKRIKNELVYLVVPKENPVNDAIEDHRVMPGETGEGFDYSVLNGQQFIFLEEEQPLQKKVNAFLSENGISVQSRIVVDQVSAAVNLSLKGAGICFASEEALEGSVKLEGVCIYPLPSVVSGRTIYVAYDKELYMTDACRQLIGLLVNNREEHGNRNKE